MPANKTGMIAIKTVPRSPQMSDPMAKTTEMTANTSAN